MAVQLQDSVNFIKDDLIPEMVHNRCFCAVDSREFVEFESASVELVAVVASGPPKFGGPSEIYRVTAVVRFSGEPQSFPLLVKLLSDSSGQAGGAAGSAVAAAFDAFQNEEMFYSKVTLKYGRDFIPKCYLADLGRYGRPVIVLEDLHTLGYRIADGKLDEDQLKLCVKLLGTVHGRGLRLKSEKFSYFREFSAKLLEISFNEEALKYYRGRTPRIWQLLRRLEDARLADKVRKKLGDSPAETMRALASTTDEELSTLCHGHFSRDNLLFKYGETTGKPVDAKLIDWQAMRYCSASVDLGPILLENLPCEAVTAGKLEEILIAYVDAVKREHPEVATDRLKADIISRLLFAWLILSFRENAADDEAHLVALLHRLDRLNAFD